MSITLVNTSTWLGSSSNELVLGVRSIPSLLAGFSRERWLLAIAFAVVAGVALGIPAAVIPNPWFGRDIDSRPLDYATLTISALLLGTLFATYIATPSERVPGASWAGGFLSFIAIGCPTCNHVAVLLLGTSGALTIFAPLQAVMAIASMGLLVAALAARARSAGSCSTEIAES